MQFSSVDLLIFALGFFSQFLYLIRSFVQWFMTERAGKVLSPLLYWQLGLVAAFLMIVYGALRKDPAIILGEFVTYYIYIRNLQIQGEWKKMSRFLRYPGYLLPIVSLVWLAFSMNEGTFKMTSGEEMASWLMIFGIAAQSIFSFRFVYQWIIAEKTRRSDLPLGFWYFSLIGGLMTIFYAIIRKDPVLFVANCSGSFMYLRNLIVHYTGRGLFEVLPFLEKIVIKRQKTTE